MSGSGLVSVGTYPDLSAADNNCQVQTLVVVEDGSHAAPLADLTAPELQHMLLHLCHSPLSAADVLQASLRLAPQDCGASGRGELAPLGATFRYTRHILRDTLRFMACKLRRIGTISDLVFAELCSASETATGGEVPMHETTPGESISYADHLSVVSTQSSSSGPTRADGHGGGARQEDSPDAISAGTNTGTRKGPVFSSPGNPYSLFVSRRALYVAMQLVLTQSRKKRKVADLRDFESACAVKEKRLPIVVLCGGTTGCGKSTFASLLASRLGITTLLSTDSTRHILRNSVTKEENPLLFASTYNAVESMQKSRLGPGTEDVCANGSSQSGEDYVATAHTHARSSPDPPDTIDPVVSGWMAQSEVVMETVTRLIKGYVARKESLIVEGVHLGVSHCVNLMKSVPNCLPFLVFISNEVKHKERFATRAKYMILDNRLNKYVHYFANIRKIQSFLCRNADFHAIPQLDNTNVDRSIAIAHSTVLGALRSLLAGNAIFDRRTERAESLLSMFETCCEVSWSSKSMLDIIKNKKSGQGHRSDDDDADDEKECEKLAENSFEEPEPPTPLGRNGNDRLKRDHVVFKDDVTTYHSEPWKNGGRSHFGFQDKWHTSPALLSEHGSVELQSESSQPSEFELEPACHSGHSDSDPNLNQLPRLRPVRPAPANFHTGWV